MNPEARELRRLSNSIEPADRLTSCDDVLSGYAVRTLQQSSGVHVDEERTVTMVAQQRRGNVFADRSSDCTTDDGGFRSPGGQPPPLLPREERSESRGDPPCRQPPMRKIACRRRDGA